MKFEDKVNILFKKKNSIFFGVGGWGDGQWGGLVGGWGRGSG